MKIIFSICAPQLELLFGEEQLGSRRGRSTEEQIFNMCMFCENMQNIRGKYITTVHISKKRSIASDRKRCEGS